MKLPVKEVALIAILTSALGLLDGELFYLAQVRGATMSGGSLNQISILFPEKLNISFFVGSLANILSAKLYDLFKEQGIFSLYLISLSIGSILLLKTITKISRHSVLGFILTLLGVIGFVSSTNDLSIALAFLLCSVELLVLTDPRPKVQSLIVPLSFLHIGIDSSYLLALTFYFFSLRNNLGLLAGTLLLLESAFVVCEGSSLSPYTSSASVLVILLGILVALRNRNIKLILFSLFTPIAFFSWELIFGQRFLAGIFFAPLVVASVWSSSTAEAKDKLLVSLDKLEKSISNFLTAKNQVAFFWLCLAFIFFQTATKFVHPINEAYLPKEAMDTLAEARPSVPPLHPITVGGYVAFRLSPIFQPEQKLNYFDQSAKISYLDARSVNTRGYRAIWQGTNSELFEKISPKSVLCQGKDRICSQLKADDRWTILSHSTLGDRILEKLTNLPTKQRENVSQKLEEESWYLLSKAPVDPGLQGVNPQP